jgi:hypothetical protein
MPGRRAALRAVFLMLTVHGSSHEGCAGPGARRQDVVKPRFQCVLAR